MAAVALVSTLATADAAGEIAPDGYLRHLPLAHPRAVRQTEANVALNLFGDREHAAYRDESPRDGIDDVRGRVLSDLALRFAPWLVKNTGAFPIDHAVFKRRSGGFPLYLDRWDVSSDHPRLVRQERLDFSGQGAACPEGPDDCRLLEILREFRPDRSRPVEAAVDPERDPFPVLYVDYPGHDPGSWNREYGGGRRRSVPENYEGAHKAYVHPFLYRADEVADDRAYELLLQYWFFYPFNDGGSNHEGDWEHVVVGVSPRSIVERRMSAGEIGQILDGTVPADDPLVIKRVEYYFHRHAMNVDFSSPNVYLPRDAWKRQMDAARERRVGEQKIFERIRAYAYRDAGEREINTHPIGFIGGDAKGLDQLFVSPGPYGRNRDSHGTFPFPGVYKGVGPAGGTEIIGRRFDHHEHARSDAVLPRDVERYDLAERLQVVPDWERLIDLVVNEHEVRKEWAWLVLPMRWGFPAAASPLAGIVAHADMGNLSIVGPAFNGGWNRPAPNAGFERYEPHQLPSFFPLDVQDNFSNKLGYLNAPVAALLSVPPLDVVGRMISLPFRVRDRRPVFFPAEQPPSRAVTLEAGYTLQRLDPSFAALLFKGDNARVNDWLHRIDEGQPARFRPTRLTRAHAGSTFARTYKVTFHLGRRFASEHTYSSWSSWIGADIQLGEPGRIGPFQMAADLRLREYAGSLRFHPWTSGRVRPFFNVGYGWTRYEIDRARMQHHALDWNDSRHWDHSGGGPGLWPNTVHAGVGVELGTIGRVPGWRGWGLRAAYTTSRHTFAGEPYSDEIWSETRGWSPDLAVSRSQIELLLTRSF